MITIVIMIIIVSLIKYIFVHTMYVLTNRQHKSMHPNEDYLQFSRFKHIEIKSMFIKYWYHICITFQGITLQTFQGFTLKTSAEPNLDHSSFINS